MNNLPNPITKKILFRIPPTNLNHKSLMSLFLTLNQLFYINKPQKRLINSQASRLNSGTTTPRNPVWQWSNKARIQTNPKVMKLTS